MERIRGNVAPLPCRMIIYRASALSYMQQDLSYIDYSARARRLSLCIEFMLSVRNPH